MISKLGFKVRISNRQNRGAHYFNDIINDITCSKLALVLIDDSNALNNLNSYLEYGIAVGMGKDVFVICEEKYIPHLPSDLHNIQVISFQAKDYKGLSHNIENTLRDYSIRLYIEAGSGDFPKRLERAISECRDFICIVTEGFILNLISNSNICWIREELLCAKRNEKTFINH